MEIDYIIMYILLFLCSLCAHVFILIFSHLSIYFSCSLITMFVLLTILRYGTVLTMRNGSSELAAYNISLS